MRAFEVAQEIGELLGANLGDQFFVRVNPSGLIEIWVSDRFLANWLDCLTALGYGDEGLTGSGGLASNFPALFTAQYIHARCCSLLRLGEQEGLIKLGEQGIGEVLPHKEQEFTPDILSKSTFNTLWLDNNYQMRCDRQATRHLISELVQMVDCLDGIWEDYPGGSNSSQLGKWGKDVVGLINAFETFWAECRIWGEVKSTSPELAKMRLGLILATRIVLKLLLVDCLDLAAPELM